MKADEIMLALRRNYVPTKQAREWAFFSELRVGTGYATYKHRKGSALSVEQRIDVWAMNLWPSKKFKRIAYEIKVSKSDFKREIEDPKKGRPLCCYPTCFTLQPLLDSSKRKIFHKSAVL